MNLKKIIPSLVISLNSLVDAKLDWTPEETLKTKTITNVQISPDNKQLLFVVREAVINGEINKFIPQIYKVNIDEGEVVQFSTALKCSIEPKWSPDGKWIAFLSDRCNDIMNLFLIRADGGEAKQITKAKKSVESFKWSPDSSHIVYVMPDEIKKEPKTSDAYEYSDINYVNKLWLQNIYDDLSARPLTPNEFYVRGFGDFGITNEEFDWSPDGKTIVFSYTDGPGLDNFYLKSSIASLDLETGQIVTWEKKSDYEGAPLFSPNGKYIAYLQSNHPKKYLLQRNVALRSSDGKFLKELTPTFNEGPFFGANKTLLGWTADSQSLLYYEPKGTKFHIMQIPIDGKSAISLLHPENLIKDPVISNDGKMIAFVSQNFSNPPEVYVSSIFDFKPKQQTKLNEYVNGKLKFHTENVYWTAKDGLALEGLLTYPKNFNPNEKYPLLLVIHGGPQGFFDQTFLGTPRTYPLASFAEQGYLIFRPNPRGSCGYGKSFREANYCDWGGKDYEDIMSGVDFLIDKGFVDLTNMGVMGWSYGGYMTAWTITQTSRFKAASMGAGISNLVSMSNTTDLIEFLPDFFNESLDKMSIYESRSPIYFVKNITTPCLIEHGSADIRVPISQSYEFYHTLKREKKDVSFMLYPKMGHAINDPKMLIDLMKTNINWFNLYLKPGTKNSIISHQETFDLISES